MTKISSLSCVMAAMLHLGLGTAFAADSSTADKSETRQVPPAATSPSHPPEKPKEETTRTTTSSGSPTKTKEEPDCE